MPVVVKSDSIFSLQASLDARSREIDSYHLMGGNQECSAEGVIWRWMTVDVKFSGLEQRE